MTSLLSAPDRIASSGCRPPAPAPAGAWSRPSAVSPRPAPCSPSASRSASRAGSSPTPAPTAQPRDALRVGALGLADGPRLRGRGGGRHRHRGPAAADACAPSGWSWRIGHQVGDSISGPRTRLRPDLRRRARLDGARGRAPRFAAGYLLVTGLTLVLAATPQTAPSAPARSGWSLLLALRSADPRSRSAAAGPRSGPPWCPATCGRRPPPAPRSSGPSCWCRWSRSLAALLGRRRHGRQRRLRAGALRRRDDGLRRAVDAAAAQRHGLRRLLPARSRLHGRRADAGLADRRRDRAAAGLPAARRAARQRPDPGLDGLAGRRPRPGRGARRGPRPAAPSDAALGPGGAARLRRWGGRRASCSRCWPSSRAARSDPAGCRSSGR